MNPQNPRQFVVTTANGNTVVWTMGRSGHPQQLQLGAPSSTVAPNDAAFSPGGSQVVVAENDGDVDVYSLATPKTPVATLNGGEANALTAAFSPDGNQIVAGYSSGTARVWDVATKLPLTELAGSAGPVLGAQFSRDGSEVVTAGEDGTIRVWYAQPRELQAEFTIRRAAVRPRPSTGSATSPTGLSARACPGRWRCSRRTGGRRRSSAAAPR